MTTAESVVRPHPHGPSTTDRRQHARARLDGPILIDAFSNWQRARCENVSMTGVALACEGRLPIGKTVEVYFELPCGVAIETQARVVRSTADRLALRFVALEHEAELALRAHCRVGAR